MSAPEWAGTLDRRDLMHVMLGHPDLALRVEIDGHLIDIDDFRYSPERQAIIPLLTRTAFKPTARPIFQESGLSDS